MEPTTQPSISAPIQPPAPALMVNTSPSRFPIIVISLLFIGALASTYYFYNKSIQYEAEISQQKADSAIALLEAKKKLAEQQSRTASSDPVGVVASPASSTSELSGNIMVSGILWWSDMFGQSCFNVSLEDAYKIPRSKEDKRDAWFCFQKPLPSNLIDKSKSSPQVGLPLTIEISNYVVFAGEKGGADSAVFVRMVQ